MPPDIAAAFRYFRRNRGFFGIAVLILALGIGASTAVFSVAETLLLRPLSYPESDRLVTLRSVNMMSDDPTTRVAPGLLADWQTKAASFEGIAGYRWATVDLIDGAQSDRLSGLLVTPEQRRNRFRSLRSRPISSSETPTSSTRSTSGCRSSSRPAS